MSVGASEYHPFPEEHGFGISPGRASSVSLKQKVVQRLPLPYDNTDCRKPELDIPMLDMFHPSLCLDESRKA